MSFQRDVVIVTGGGGGIGRAVCSLLAESDSHVVIVDIEGVAAEAAKALSVDGKSLEGHGCNVSDRAEVEALVADILKRHGRIDAVFCLAGVVRNAKLPAVTDEDFELTMSSHVGGTLNFLRAVAPIMKEQKRGRIVVTSSVAARGTVGGTSYGAAKGAIEGMMRAAAIELARYGVTVNCVAPGIIDGGMFWQQPEKQRNHMLDRTPMRRVGNPQEVAEAYRFLGSRGASFITGQTLYVCGGASVGAFV